MALAASLAAMPAPVSAALVCDPLSNAEEAAQADAVFTGAVGRHFSDGSQPAPWVQPWLDRWPPWLPVPVVTVPGPGTPAVTMRVTTLYKGDLGGSEVTVRLLGRVRLPGGTWTLFANRDPIGFYTTECSGDVPAAIDPRAYALPPGRAVSASPWWQAALAAAAAVLLALGLGAAAVAGAHALAGRRRR